MKINNNIKESFCSFKVSTVLKREGFEVPTYYFYNELGEVKMKIEDSGCNESEYYFDHEEFLENWNQKNMKVQFNDDAYCVPISRPSHHIALEWIKINFNINIVAIENYYWNNETKNRWKYQIVNMNENDKNTSNENFFMESNFEFATSENAIDIAILHVLENVIK
jgi:hypothetical protein